MLRSVVPDPSDYPVFSYVKRVLVEYMNGCVEVVPICVNNCMAFYNCKSAGFQGDEYQTADCNFCTICGEDRWLRSSIHGLTGTNRKVAHIGCVIGCIVGCGVGCCIRCHR